MGPLSSATRQVVVQQSAGATEATRALETTQKSSIQAKPTSPPVKAPPSPDELKKLVSDIQSKIPVVSKELRFSVDQESGRSVVTLTDRATKEVLWQVPSEVAMRISKELDQFLKGTLVNRQA